MFPLTFRRRQLLPVWIKVFIWLFMLLGLSAIVSRCLDLAGVAIGFGDEKTIYGLTSYEQYSLLSIFISSLLIFKGVVAFGMWTEKIWAMKLAIMDALLGIIITVTVMFIQPMLTMESAGKYSLNFRFELLLLIPYLIFCVKVKFKWEQFSSSPTGDLSQNITQTPTTFSQQNNNETKKDDTIIKTEKPEAEDKEDPRRFMPK